jgi:hypothetical protein
MYHYLKLAKSTMGGGADPVEMGAEEVAFLTFYTGCRYFPIALDPKLTAEAVQKVAGITERLLGNALKIELAVLNERQG